MVCFDFQAVWWIQHLDSIPPLSRTFTASESSDLLCSACMYECINVCMYITGDPDLSIFFLYNAPSRE
jgi:hypothetical protein